MSLSSVKDIVNSELIGKVRQYTWRKNPSQTTTAGLWFDISMSSGNPVPKYWFDAAPLTAKAAYQSTDGGLFHGANVSTDSKYLRMFTAMTATATALPLTIIVCDYCLYYPSIDEGTTDIQTLDNTVTLPRYTDGIGLQILPITVGTRTATAQFNVTYTNSEGIAGRTSQTVTLNTASVGTVATAATATQDSGNPFIGLQIGDSGVRSIEAVNMLGLSDGLFSLILVKPLAYTMIRGIDAPVEKDFLVSQEQLPVIYDNAFVSFLCLPQGTLAGTGLIGDLKVVWG
jgi:hypothetical protein